MSDPIQTVQKFFQGWETSQGFRKAIPEYMTPDCVYENVGLTLANSPAEALAVMQGFVDQMDFDRLMVEMLAIAAVGNTVLTARIDDLYDSQGTKRLALRVMGVLEVRDGKIAAWRDYFDTAPFKG